MKILRTKHFEKRFLAMDKKYQARFAKKLVIFLENPFDSRLKNHPLKGNLIGCRSFSVTDDIRVIYRIINKNTVRFISVGTHNQVY